MAKINKLQKNSETIYPATIPQAIVDPETGISLKNSSLNCYSCGSGSKFKLCRLNTSETRGVFKFTIISDVNFLGEYIIAWYTTIVNIYCLYATTSQMVAAAKLVKIDDNTYDIYYDAGVNGEVSFTILGVSNYLIIEDIFISSVSEIPTVYKSSEYAGIYGKFRGNADTATDVTNLHAATTSKIGGVKSGTDIVVGGDGSVVVNNRIIPKMYKMGVNTNYKLFSIKGGTDKGSIVFSILSPVLSSGRGYAKYIIHRTYESTTVKNWYPKCLYATDSSMYNRIKLVRTGDKTFDVYYQSNEDNDYCTFILDETTLTDLEIVTAGVSSIPEDIYKESEYTPVYLGNIYTGNSIVLEKTSLTKTPYIYTDNNSGRGIVLRWNDSEGDLKELGMWNDGTPYWATNYNTRYTLYHTGNLVNATTSKAGLMSNTDKSKLNGIETGATKNKVHYIHGEISDGFGTIDYSTIDDKNAWKTNEPIYFINDYFNSDKQSIPLSFGVDGTYLYITFVGVDPVNGKRFIASDKVKFTDSITSTDPLVVSYLPEGDLDSKFIKFNNSSDTINIDNYPQNDYGTITIWYNFAQADGTSPGQEGVIYQTKYKSEQGNGGSGYVDCLTQLYVGSGGIKQRTVINYNVANPFDGIPWS